MTAKEIQIIQMGKLINRHNKQLQDLNTYLLFYHIKLIVIFELISFENIS